VDPVNRRLPATPRYSRGCTTGDAFGGVAGNRKRTFAAKLSNNNALPPTDSHTWCAPRIKKGPSRAAVGACCGAEVGARYSAARLIVGIGAEARCAARCCRQDSVDSRSMASAGEGALAQHGSQGRRTAPWMSSRHGAPRGLRSPEGMRRCANLSSVISVPTPTNEVQAVQQTWARG